MPASHNLTDRRLRLVRLLLVAQIGLLAGIAVLVAAMVALAVSGDAAAAGTVFSVTDPARGLYNMHPALLVEEALNG